MPFELPDLPYPYDALEPHIDAETMRIHHDAHHKAYVDNANAALAGTEWADRPVEAVLTVGIDVLPEEKQAVVRNNAGGHANHSLFWQIMSPDGGGAPSGELASAIDDVFGSLDELKKALNDGGVKRFGSGWTWLVWDGTGLSVYSTPNQDSPLLKSDVPLLGIDVWEHAYYLKYQNKRPAYLEAWWNVVNWDEVAKRYAEARAAVVPHARPARTDSMRPYRRLTVWVPLLAASRPFPAWLTLRKTRMCETPLGR
jgi:Fe-Mn family superoxide dismutase